MLTRIARASFHHRRLVLGLWVAVALVAITIGPSLAGSYANTGRLPHTDSQRAADLIARDFPSQHGDQAQIVFADFANHRAAVARYLHTVALAPGVLGVQSLEVSHDGTVAVAPITTSNASSAHPTKIARHIEDLAAPVRAQGVDVEFAGGWFASGSLPASETVGVLAAIMILLIAFGSMIAMGLPILTALVGITISLCGVGILTHVVTTPSFVPQVAAMIGIRVGIDYALFIVTRYRAALRQSGSPELAVIEAMRTSGRAVVFAGVTVMISVLGMFLIGLNFLYGLATGTSVAVAIAVLAATTLLPAMLGFVGSTIDRFHVGPRHHVTRETMWHRWARTLQHHPGVIAAAGLVVLVLAGLPTFAMRLGSADAHNDPKSSTTYKAYELISHGFGPGANGPIFVVMDATRPGSASAVPRVIHALQTTPGVAGVGEVRPDAHGNAAIATLIATTDPQDKATERLVHHIRDHVVPQATAGTGLVVRIGGQTAGAIDFTDTMSNRMPLFIAGVLGLSFLLLLVVFRSVLVPLKAVLMNLLSIGAAYGVIVAIFQWGWASGIVGVQKGPIEAWVPMMLFAIVFGMSMDYEVFLLSSIREEYDRTGDNGTAVAEGLSNTAHVITAAALIMVFVFGSFVASDIRALKLIGLGLAVAIAVDASIVRMVLVPATMELLGDANWWFPRWIGRIVPEVRVDGGDIVTDEPAPERDLVSVGR